MSIKKILRIVAAVALPLAILAGVVQTLRLNAEGQSVSRLEEQLDATRNQQRRERIEAQTAACRAWHGRWSYTDYACEGPEQGYYSFREQQCNNGFEYDQLLDSCLAPKPAPNNTMVPPPLAENLADQCPAPDEFCSDGHTTLPPGATNSTAPPTYAPPATLPEEVMQGGSGSTPCPEGTFPQGSRCHQD